MKLSQCLVWKCFKQCRL